MTKKEQMPLVGFGTWLITDKEVLKNTINAAIKTNQKLIDTAIFYKNHKQIGEVLQELEVNRDDLWITTKIPPLPFFHKKKMIIKKVKDSLKELQLEYLDLMLIHSTFRSTKKNVSAIKGLLQAKEDGLINHWGVSNMGLEEIQAIHDELGVYPYCAQIVLSPKTRITELEQFCKKNNILLTGYSIIKPYFEENANPFFKEYLMSNEEKEIIDSLCTKYNKNVGQLLNKWALQHDYHIIPKSEKVSRVETNADLFDFTISHDDIITIDNMNKMNNKLYSEIFNQSLLKQMKTVRK